MIGHLVWGGGCALIGLLLIFSGFAKVRSSDYATRYRTVEGYRIVPASLVWPLVCILPPVEVTLGGHLIARDPRGVYSLLAALIMLLFAAGAAQALLRGIVTECGCLGTLSSQNVSWLLVGRNTVFAVFLILAGTVGRSFGWVLDPGFDDGLPMDILVIGVWFAVEWALSSDARRTSSVAGARSSGSG